MRTLNVSLKKKWFDMIFVTQEKKEEYREIKPYWTKRIDNGPFDKMKGVNGYGDHRPNGVVEVTGIRIGEGRPEWGAIPCKTYWIIELGDVLTTPK